MIELACPSTCQYLIAAVRPAIEREQEMRAREAASEGRALPTPEARWAPALYAIDNAVFDLQRGIDRPAMSDLQDAEFLAAVENAIKNLEIEASGLIYEQAEASHRVQMLSRHIREKIDEVISSVPSEDRPRRSDILKALAYERDALRIHVRRAAGDPSASRTYLRYIAMFVAWPEETTKPLITLA